jgi:hypothetical protein
LWFIPGTVNVVGDDAWIDGFEMFLGAPELEALDEHAASSTNATANHAKLRTLLFTGTETHIARSGVFSPRHPIVRELLLAARLSNAKSVADLAPHRESAWGCSDRDRGSGCCHERVALMLGVRENRPNGHGDEVSENASVAEWERAAVTENDPLAQLRRRGCDAHDIVHPMVKSTARKGWGQGVLAEVEEQRVASDHLISGVGRGGSEAGDGK